MATDTSGGAGVFEAFQRGRLDSTGPLVRIGGGELGGKAQGLARVRSELFERLDPAALGPIQVDIPPLVVLGTDVFDVFMEQNRLYDVAYSDLPDERIAHAFLKAELPFDMLGDLTSLVARVHTPLAVRSSSLMEDSVHQPFAGVYGTKMMPNGTYDPDLRFRQLAEAIRFVYASTFSHGAKDYRAAIGHGDEGEKMAVILQQLVGRRHHVRYYPEISGVARTYNYYPMEPARPEEGVVSLALGLGKTIVDGGVCWAYSPAHPKVDPPFGSVEKLLKETQTRFWSVNLGPPPAYDPSSETEYLTHEDLSVAERDGVLEPLVSTYSPLSGRLSIGMGFEGPRALTFAPLLVLEQIPLTSLLRELLRACEGVLGCPVEIEFAMTLDPPRFSLLQVRAMETPAESPGLDEQGIREEEILVSSDTALGNGVEAGLVDVVYTRPESFDLTHTQEVVADLARWNRTLLKERRPYALIVLGRLGTTDPWLGIPIDWAKISGARVVVEATGENVRVELSQGSHFFHNIVSLGVKYFNLPIAGAASVDWDWLARQPAVDETPFLRHVRLARPLLAQVDGRSGRGLIARPPEAA
jgi:hypothetical protein